MSEYTATVSWKRNKEEVFIDNKYSRGHDWGFDGGAIVKASSSPHIVPIPQSVEAYVDPEEAFIASLSSCHMLFFLGIAAKKRFVIDSYIDNALGTMSEVDNKMMMSKVLLRPQVAFSGEKQPSQDQIQQMHHLAHQQCFIANSVLTEVVVETQ